MDVADSPGEAADRTPESAQVRRAVDGDSEALNWCIEKFSPWLLALAQRRMPPALQKKYPPTDLVQDTWLTVLPKLASIEERGGRKTPVLMKFLMTTQLNLQNTLFRKHIQGKPIQVGEATGSRSSLLGNLPASITGPVTKIVRQDGLEHARAAIQDALDVLSDEDRELVLQRMQGLSYKEIAELAGGNPNQLGVRFHRAIHKLRENLDDELLDDFEPRA
ncbi:MAG: sigma-70 family RNA polymerase sigma factor [Planctomycetes bacterium]|nr:sigma-70 family RNA polymerase sigma factor [Planctomycetota bacterium]